MRPGAVRIASTSFGTTGWNGQIMDAAFRNRDGSTALVVHNENDDPRTSPSRRAAASFEYTLPGGALATFTWPASRALDDGLRAARRRSGTHGDRARGDAARGRRRRHHALDHRRRAGSPGQTLQVDLGRVQRVRRVVLDTGADVGDYPRGFTLSHQHRRHRLARSGRRRR